MFDNTFNYACIMHVAGLLLLASILTLIKIVPFVKHMKWSLAG